jgi:hypothetical protein
MGEGGMTARRLRSATLGALLLASGCATMNHQPPDTLPMIAPGHVLALPRPGDLGRSVEATQLITVHRGKEVHAFEGHISVTPERLLLVGLDGMGRRGITLTWDKSGKVSGETAKWMKDPVPPGPMLADLIVLYWPEASVRDALAGADATLVAKPGSRSVMVDDAEVLHVDYQNSAQPSWSGSLHYKNDAWGYEIDVKSVEATP